MAENFWDIDLSSLNDISFNLLDEDKNLVVSTKSVPSKLIKYENAEKLAKRVNLDECARYECIIRGNFIFGDFIEAFFVENDIYTKELTISTLSLGYENVDSLNNLIKGGYVGKIRLLASCYFYANERKNGGIVDYLFKTIEKDRILCAFADVHTKMVTFIDDKKRSIVITGSANLRSSGCIEQFSIERNKELFKFFDEYHNEIFNLSDSTEKQIRKKTLNINLKTT